MFKPTIHELVSQMECYAIVAPSPERKEMWSRLAAAFRQNGKSATSGAGDTAGVAFRSKQTGETFYAFFPARIYRGDGEGVQFTHQYQVYVAEDGRAYLMTPMVAEAILEPCPEGKT